MKRRPAMRIGTVLGSALLLAAGAAQAATPGTVAAVVQSNGFLRDHFALVRTPGILAVQPGMGTPPDPRRAIEDYDRAAALTGDPLIRAEALRRAADLRLQLAVRDDPPEAASLNAAIAGYRRLIAEQPAYGDGRVQYQLARAEQLAGHAEAGIEALRALGAQFPDSPLAADAAFRAGEWLYRAGRNAEAAEQYRQVLAKGNAAPQFEPAEYKLGWALYRQGQYDAAAAALLALLDRELPAVPPATVEAAIGQVRATSRELARDALRVTDLAFIAGGGAAALDRYCDHHAEPRFALLLYRSLAAALAARGRYSDAAASDIAYVARHPNAPQAPDLQAEAIATLRQGGLGPAVAAAEARYAIDYAPGAAYWAGAAPSATVRAQRRAYLGELGLWAQAQAQSLGAADRGAAKAGFLAAARWYRRLLDDAPDAPEAAQTRMRYADALHDGGALAEAAAAYGDAAYGSPGFARAEEAGYAQVQVLQQLADSADAQARPGALTAAAGAAVRYADTFAHSARSPIVVLRAAEDRFALAQNAAAIALAQRALAMPGASAAGTDLHARALALLGDARFADADYRQAEARYAELLTVIDGDDPRRPRAAEQLAVAIYRQGQAAQAAGDWPAAARAYARVGTAAPNAGIREQAAYAAAAAWSAAHDWPAARDALEGFRSRYPQSPRLGDVDKRLAQADREDGRPGAAAAVYARIAVRPGEDAEIRRQAAWLSATLYDAARDEGAATAAYRRYLIAYPEALAQGIAARQRLAVMTDDAADRRRWWADLIGAESRGGAARTDETRQAAAQAALALGRLDAAAANAVRLSQPLKASVERRLQATRQAIGELEAAAAYRDATVTTAATYAVGRLYQDLADALLAAPRPAGLAGEAAEQYALLLAEQVDPFEQKAIAAYRANLQRLDQGLWNDWIGQSAVQLGVLAPAHYSKQERQEDRYEALR